MLRVKLIKLASITAVPDVVTVVVDDAPVLEKEEVEVDLQVLVSQGKMRPFAGLRGNHFRFEVVTGNGGPMAR